MKLFTIGFTKHSAEFFFTKLGNAGVKGIIDTRLNVTSQLSGFAKRDDLKFFLRKINHADYHHDLNLAPTAEILKEYRNSGNWDAYARKFKSLLHQRKIEDLYTREELEDTCLLCSEFLPHHCHRRLVAEYLAQKWKHVRIIHL